MRSSNPKYPDIHTNQSGVGARQENGQAPEWGGGYQNNYTNFKLPIEAQSSQKLRRELESLPLPPVWKSLLNIVDPEQFLAIWQTLSNETANKGTNRINVPSFKKFEVMQRNLMIRSLASSGHLTSDIHAKVSSLFGQFSTKTLERAMKR